MKKKKYKLLSFLLVLSIIFTFNSNLIVKANGQNMNATADGKSDSYDGGGKSHYDAYYSGKQVGKTETKDIKGSTESDKYVANVETTTNGNVTTTDTTYIKVTTTDQKCTVNMTIDVNVTNKSKGTHTGLKAAEYSDGFTLKNGADSASEKIVDVMNSRIRKENEAIAKQNKQIKELNKQLDKDHQIPLTPKIDKYTMDDAKKLLRAEGYREVDGILVDKNGKRVYTLDIEGTYKKTKAKIKESHKKKDTEVETETETETQPSEDTEEEHVCTPVDVTDGTHWYLYQVNQTGNSIEFTSSNPDKVNGETKNVGQNEICYSGPVNPSDGYYDNSSWNDSQQKPFWVGQDITYTAIWYEVRKYHIECSGCGAYMGGPYFSICNTSTQSKRLTYDANIHQTVWEELKAMDLTTEEGYNGLIKTPKLHEFESRRANKVSNDTVNVTITNKGGYKKGEMLQLTDTNKKQKFSIDFNDSWLGIPRSANLEGVDTYIGDKSKDGYQFVHFAKLYYGSESQNTIRNIPISTLSKFDKINEELTGTDFIYQDHDDSTLQCEHKFNLRSTHVSDTDNYKLGEDGDEAWITYFELVRNNWKGIDWSASASSNPGSLEAQNEKQDYTKYVIANIYAQPILYGEYQVKTVAGDME